jgi:hypothetical protein
VTLTALATDEVPTANVMAGLAPALNSIRRNNRLYVRLIPPSAGTVVGGAALPGPPASVSVYDDDGSNTTPVAKPSSIRTAVAWSADRANLTRRHLP